MNSYERTIAALNLEVPDRVPLLEWSINSKVIEEIEPGMSNHDFMAKYLDVVTTFWSPDSEGIMVDEWGVTRDFSGQDFAIPIDYPIKSHEQLKDFDPPDPMNDDRLDDLRVLVDSYEGKKATCFMIGTVFFRAWSLVGMQEFFKIMKRDPEFAFALLNMSFDYNYRLTEEALNIGADIVMCGDDLAYKKGLLISPDDYHTFLHPYYKKISELIHSKGGYFIKHTDGNIWSIMDDLIFDIGIDCINPLEPVAGMEIGEVKEEYGDDVCLCGNIDCGDLLSFGSTDEVIREVKDTIDKTAPKGGFILASSNEIHASVNPENFMAMIETTKEYGVYD